MEIDSENRIIRMGIILFWWLFWLCSVLSLLGVGGEDHLGHFAHLLEQVSLVHLAVVVYYAITTLQIIAFLFLTASLIQHFRGEGGRAHAMLFWASLVGLAVFSVFTIGDQLLNSGELLEHTLYWIAIVLSWYIYTHSERLLELYLNQKER